MLFAVNHQGQTPLDICIEDAKLGNKKIQVITNEEIVDSNERSDSTDEQRDDDEKPGQLKSFIGHVGKVMSSESIEKSRKRTPEEIQKLEQIKKS